MEANEDATLRLPLQVISMSDVARLEREIENINDFFDKSSLQGANTKNLPQISTSMRVILEDNKLNLIELGDRKKLTEFIKYLKQNAKVVSISFAVEPKPDSLMKLLQWFRSEAHPNVVFKVGLQPTIAAGCVIRTSSKYYDFSFKHQFAESKAKLSQALGRV